MQFHLYRLWISLLLRNLICFQTLMILLKNFVATLTVQIVWILNVKNVDCLRNWRLWNEQYHWISINGNKWIVGRKRYPYRLMLRMLLSDSIRMLNNDASYSLKHIQHTAFDNLKSNLKEREENWIYVDYSENYVNKDKAGIQGAYFGKECFSIFNACCSKYSSRTFFFQL